MIFSVSVFEVHSIVLPHINYETTSSRQVNLIKHFYKTNRFRKYSITKSVVEVWSKIPNI